MEHPPEHLDHAHPHYLVIFLVLAVLTLAEVGIAFVSHLPHTTLILVLLGLSVWKALLVALYFMHLKYENFRVRLLILTPIPLVIALLVATLWDWMG